MNIAGAVMNGGGQISTSEFARELKKNLPTERVFVISPPRGVAFKSAVDWLVVLNTSAALITLTNALWALYKKYIIPLRVKRGNASLGVMLSLQNPGGEDKHIVLKGEFKSKREFSKKIEDAFGNMDVNAPLPRSSHWKELK